MPRLSPHLVRHALLLNPNLARLLRECRDLESAKNELRWLAGHAYNNKVHHANPMSPDARLMQYVQRRATGEPLQYILGNQPFGDLDILCRRNVLIPRPETELYTTTLAGLLNKLRKEGIADRQQSIRIADLCTGTGCITLLLHALLCAPDVGKNQDHNLHLLGVDISPYALRLARRNLQHNIECGLLNVSCAKDVSFALTDVLELGQSVREIASTGNKTAEAAECMTQALLKGGWDVIISNPPYISSTEYAPGGSVPRSVRNHEPQLALVPPPLPAASAAESIERADQFYEALLYIARQVQAKVIVLEIGDSNQAMRVRKLVTNILSDTAILETWRDDGTADYHNPTTPPTLSPHDVNMAHERAVVAWLGPWAQWRLNTRA